MPVYYMWHHMYQNQRRHSESGQHWGSKTSMKSVAKKFLTHHEVSAQEAIYRLMSLVLV